jgi:hypothetical protein
MPADMKEQLTAAAADRGSSLTQEILGRLQWSLDKDRELDRDPASYSLSYLLGEVIKHARVTVRPRKWRSDPYAWCVVRLTFNKILDALAPPGKIQVPPPKDDPIWSGPNHPVRFGDTPEQTADFFSRTIMFMYENHETMPLLGRGWSRWDAVKYGMADASRALEIRKEK